MREIRSQWISELQTVVLGTDSEEDVCMFCVKPSATAGAPEGLMWILVMSVCTFKSQPRFMFQNQGRGQRGGTDPPEIWKVKGGLLVSWMDY